MDPDANLREQLEIAQAILADKQRDNPFAAAHHGFVLAKLVLSLDEWISNGGFLPRRWQRKEP